MTKVIILGEETKKEEKKLKPIKFLYYLSSHNVVSEYRGDVAYFDYVELIASDYCGYQLMYAYKRQNRNKGVLGIGYFNDGVV